MTLDVENFLERMLEGVGRVWEGRRGFRKETVEQRLLLRLQSFLGCLDEMGRKSLSHHH